MLRSDILDSPQDAQQFNPDYLDANLIASYAGGWHAEDCEDILADFELNKGSMLRQSCRCSNEVANSSDATPVECSFFSHKEHSIEADPEAAADSSISLPVGDKGIGRGD